MDIIGKLTKLECGIKKYNEKCCVNDKFPECDSCAIDT